MKRRPPTPISADDARLFREAVGEVRRIDPVAAPPATPKPAPLPRMFEADEAAVPGELLEMAFDPAALEVGEELAYLRDGYAPKALDTWAERAKTWAAGGDPESLPLLAASKKSKARDVFVYFINGAKERAPAAAMALLDRL